MAKPKQTFALVFFLTLAIVGCANQAPVSGDANSAPGAETGYLLFRIGTGVPPGESMPEAYSKGTFQWSALVIRNVATGESYRVWRGDRTWLDPELVELPPGKYYFDRVRTMVQRTDISVLSFFRANGFEGGSFAQLELDLEEPS